MTAGQVLGALMLLAVFGGLFVATALASTWLLAALTWGAGIALAAVGVAGIYLLVGDPW